MHTFPHYQIHKPTMMMASFFSSHFHFFCFFEPSKTLISMFSFTWRFSGWNMKTNIIILVRSVFAPLAFIIIHYNIITMSHEFVSIKRENISIYELFVVLKMVHSHLPSRLISYIEIINAENASVYSKCEVDFWELIMNNCVHLNIEFHSPMIQIEIRSKLNVFFSPFIFRSTKENKIKWKL